MRATVLLVCFPSLIYLLTSDRPIGQRFVFIIVYSTIVLLICGLVGVVREVRARSRTTP